MLGGIQPTWLWAPSKRLLMRVHCKPDLVGTRGGNSATPLLHTRDQHLLKNSWAVSYETSWILIGLSDFVGAIGFRCPEPGRPGVPDTVSKQSCYVPCWGISRRRDFIFEPSAEKI